MSTPDSVNEGVGSASVPARWSAPNPSGVSPGAPNASGVDPERLLLDAAALRRRQLCVAFLHGSTRSWRIRRRIWPATVAGLLIVAVVIAALAVAGAFARQQELDSRQESASLAWSLLDSGDPAG